ncbi:uncharacterized protein MJAP1_003565 [Malassezia japonica]|uniref:COX assembly mitochondrial protein n=1 Tax=Malassezia japonica TaxID=223818 RepID=A0AAF0F4U4_9BASI|nr:uncharacterized protein MJAP1_003565 [Malassezia japonica]WFD40577.1 hypothetical protein MJAP1_003565 [Malassezia japonica]
MSSENKSRVMSNREYDRFLKDKKLEAFKRCDPLVQEFVHCSQNRLLSVAWACRQQNRNMFNCLREYMSDEAMAKAEKEYLDKNRPSS